ncbi:hypothetical protein Bca4012_026918 [Brassica carinata]
MNSSDNADVEDKALLRIYANKIEKIAREGVKGIKGCLKVTPQQRDNKNKLVNDCKERIKRAAPMIVPSPSSSRKASASSLDYDMSYKFPNTRLHFSKRKKDIEVHLQPLKDSCKHKGVSISSDVYFNISLDKSNTPFHCMTHSLNSNPSSEWLGEENNRKGPHQDFEITRERKYCIMKYFPNQDERREVKIEYSNFLFKLGRFCSWIFSSKASSFTI